MLATDRPLGWTMVAPSHQGLKSENKSIDDPLRLVGRAKKAGANGGDGLRRLYSTGRCNSTPA